MHLLLHHTGPTAGPYSTRLPNIMNLSHERLSTEGMYLMENGTFMLCLFLISLPAILLLLIYVAPSPSLYISLSLSLHISLPLYPSLTLSLHLSHSLSHSLSIYLPPSALPYILWTLHQPHPSLYSLLSPLV